MYAPDKYQQPIIDAVIGRAGNIQVEAVAGSGKSSTLEAAAAECDRQDRKTTVICFAKAIQVSMEARLKKAGLKNVTASTIHSLGNRAISRALGAARVDGDKGRTIVAEIIGDSFEMRTVRGLAKRIVDLAKVTLVDPTREGIDSLVEHYSLDAADVNGDMEIIYDAVPKAMKLAAERPATIDFSDMVWLPHKLGLPVEQFDTVMVDESQDLNAIQRHIALATKAAQTITVGDERQAIFGFAGADVESMKKLRTELNAKPMPMSVCYRCPTSHLDLARKIVPQIEARPGAPVGEIVEATLSQAYPKMRDGDLILCRMNAPLAEIAMALIRAGKKASIKGRDLSSSLLSLVERWMRGLSLSDGLARLLAWQDREVVKLEKMNKASQIDAVMDRVATVVAISDGLRDVAALNARINSIFVENPTEGVILSSVHRAKGLEADRVMIYKPELLPWPKAMPGTWQYEQEMNLKYVALTRAKQSLWFVSEDES
jgi:superfamily I DNA/RNA helicase